MKFNYSTEERIDNISLAYVTSKYDVSKMSVEEFMETYKTVFCEVERLYIDSNS